VIFALKEKYGNDSEEVDAKRLSDGTLRCIAIVAAVLTGPENSIVVVEEIDNGVHPGRAKGLIDSISTIGKHQNIDLLITTHNATLLNGLSRDNLLGVSVAYRDEKTGESLFQPFVDVKDYPKLLAMGGLGDSVVDDSLIKAIKTPSTVDNDLSWLGVAK
jgi:predicted ATPase